MVHIKKNMQTRDQNKIRLQKPAEWWQQRMQPGRNQISEKDWDTA